jgi:acetyl-CoA carboxylase biotin carboxylase subunit
LFSKILIANRGEIAVRVIRACREMGIKSVAVFSEADADALHVSLADEAVCIGGAQSKDSYLNQNAIISAALSTGAQAIHPGYGFLSENAAFASLCQKYGIVFIGPSAEVISKMGDKDTARKMMEEAGVPITKGTGILKDVEDAKNSAKKIGYPVMIKATAGGGGRGIRIVENEESLASAYMSASSEAESAFGNGDLYMEKYLYPVKHIEVQLLCDRMGNVVCVGERECSIQNRNQKLLEESPSVAVTPFIRSKLYEAATKAAKAANYTSLGTVEFLLDKEKNIYFMEMNTRLQVEHPVTEMVTGVDLVKWQIRIAAGVALDFTEKDVEVKGHAIECRINATGGADNRVAMLHVPGGFGVRFDTALYQDYKVPPFYDSMIGKLIVHAKTREEAIRKMQAALCEIVILGVETNRDTQISILEDKDFIKGEYYTDFCKRKFK